MPFVQNSQKNIGYIANCVYPYICIRIVPSNEPYDILKGDRLMQKNFERFGYIAKVVGIEGGNAILTIKNPAGKVVKRTEYKNVTSAISGWYRWCGHRNMYVRPHEQDTVVIDINIPDPEEPIQIIEEPAPTADKIANTLPLTAIIDFNFTNVMNLSLTEWIQDINNRIKSGEYHPSEIVRIRLVPNS